MSYTAYESPFSSRYASEKMQYIFSQENKFKTFRRLWIALAKAEKELGLNITDEQIAELEKFKDDINFSVAEEREKIVRHDVMAHIYAYGQQAPSAKPIIHLGATSCYVGDNTDIIIMKQGLELLEQKVARCIFLLAGFAEKYKDLPCLAYTHLQPAQPTTVGKRTCLWINELLYDLKEIKYRISNLELLGQKGTTGTQASFMELFDGDEEKVKKLENLICKEMGFEKAVPVSGQTYSRKIDSQILNTLSGIAQSASKFANDMRILANFKEMEEPFEKNQVGSSAMPYKRNPMRCERITALSRYVISNSINPAFTAATQWFERTLDDSANKRIAVAEAFLACDSILNIYINVANGIVIYPKIIEKRLRNELPFMATENIMMEAVKKGGDRQILHERIRTHSVAAANRIKQDGLDNDLLDRISKDDLFGLTKEELEKTLDPKLYIGRCPGQVTEFLNEIVHPAIDNYSFSSDEELHV